MTPPLPSLTVEVACRKTARVGLCFEPDCPFEASILVEATSPGYAGMTFACDRHLEEGVLRALAYYVDAVTRERAERLGDAR